MKNSKCYLAVNSYFSGIIYTAGERGWCHEYRLAEASVNLATLKELLGHLSFKTTMRYAHISDETKMQAVKLLDIA